MMASTYIIAEAGVNHNGSIKLARELVEKAADIGADAIKFQSFKSEDVVIPSSPKADYQKQSSPESKTQYDLLKSLELSKDAFLELRDLCRKHKIDFLCTPFSFDSLIFLLEIGIKTIKFSSGDLTYGPLLLKAAQSRCRVFLSTGMADESEIEQALAVLAFGYSHPNKTPNSLAEILKFYTSQDSEEILKEKVVVLHCTSEYPAPFDQINLNVLDKMQEKFSTRVGYSDHSPGILVPSLAVAKGATVIEKHITLDRNMSGPDHAASLDIQQFSEMIQQIRLTETILGVSDKRPTPAELKNKPVVRRGLYAGEEIQKGQRFSNENMKALRPEGTRSPMMYWDVLGEIAERSYEELEKI